MKLIIAFLFLSLTSLTGCMVHTAHDEAWTYAKPGQPIYMQSHNYYPMYRRGDYRSGYSRYRAYGKR